MGGNELLYEKFEKLTEEKKERIIKASFIVFGKEEYTIAHVDDIASIANVSKGSLFNYFESKKNLFLYMFDYAVNFIMNSLDLNVILKEKDFFRRLMEIQKFELSLIDKYPDIIKFFELALIVRDSGINEIIMSKVNGVLNVSFNRYFDDIDTSKFNDGIDMNKVYKMYSWLTTGIVKELVNNTEGKLDYYLLFKEYIEYLDIFRKGVYKKEYHNESINILDYIKK